MWFRGVTASMGLCFDFGAVLEAHPDVILAVECQGDGSLDSFLFIVYSVPGVNNHAEKSQNAE